MKPEPPNPYVVAACYEQYWPLIQKVALAYSNSNPVVDLDDLMQECYLAVHSAVSSYNRTRPPQASESRGEVQPRNNFLCYLHLQLRKACQ